MTQKIVSSIKYFGAVALVLIAVIACEKDFENVGVGLVDNNLFGTEHTVFPVVSYNENTERSQTNGNPNQLLGIYNTPSFGLLQANVIGQVNLNTTKYGDGVSIDAVILDIPYYTTKLEDNEDKTPNFRLDSIIGDQDAGFKLSVYENGTYMNLYDPNNPAKRKIYYSDDTYTKKDLLFSKDDFKPNKNDTVIYIPRRYLDNDPSTVEYDTIKKENLAPSIKIPLDTTYFRNKFVNQQNSEFFSDGELFKTYFRGLIIEATGEKGAMMNLPMGNAGITVYFTNTVLTDETDTDLNNDGDTDDTDVPVRTKQSITYNMSGIIANQYLRDYGMATSDIASRLASPDTINGEENLYVQGASGSIAVLELFKGMDLDSLREQNWLINSATLTFYVQFEKKDSVPESLYLYKYDSNSKISDEITEALGIMGSLIRSDDNKPEKYEFSITDYISEVLKQKENNPGLSKLAIKDRSIYDRRPSRDQPLDTTVNNRSYNARGVKLRGNNLAVKDKDSLKLEIFYTISNNN